VGIEFPIETMPADGEGIAAAEFCGKIESEQGESATEESMVGLGEEYGDPTAISRELVALSLLDLTNQPLSSQPSQVVAGLSDGIGSPEESLNPLDHVAVAEPVEEVGEAHQRPKHGHRPRLPETQSGGVFVLERRACRLPRGKRRFPESFRPRERVRINRSW
jgi:hypothetical protein